uniref:Major facilitator superfamily (MFS) profile domain-containing protein n=1 Tax=Stegastes partitus TaxID=144197 RepID=A0A3B4ZCM9_9TELE
SSAAPPPCCAGSPKSRSGPRNGASEQRRAAVCGRRLPPGRGRARVTHAVVVIFLEFFAWGLLTTPMLTVLHETFPQHTFLMNGLVQGVKGFLSFLSAPLIGALSDIWGRKSFLLMTVFFTCAPIPFMRISPCENFCQQDSVRTKERYKSDEQQVEQRRGLLID